VHIQPSALDIATHDVNPAVGRIAIARAELVERGDEKVQIVNLETGAVEEKTIAAQDDPIIQAQSKPMVDQKRVFEIFTFADGVTRYLLSTMQRVA
jgi:hypothetical protein